MRRSRTWTAVVLGLALGGVVLTGCGSSGGSSTSSGSQAGGSVPAPAKEAAGSSAGADSGTSQGAPSATNAGGSKGGATTTPTAPDVANRSVIRTADVQIRTKDVTGSVRRAEDLATAAQGIVSGEKTYADPEQRDKTQAVVTFRVPEAAYTGFLRDLGRLGTVIEQTQSATDVTGEVVDVASRVKTQQTSVERVRALLAKATTVGEVVSIEAELARREADLEALEARQAALADQTTLATVTATFVSPETKVAPVKHERGFLHGLAVGWDAFVASGTVLLAALGAMLPFVGLALVVGIPLLLAWRRRRGPALSPPAPPAAPAEDREPAGV